MGYIKISDEKVKRIIELRKNGLSLDQIRKDVLIGRTTIYSYLKDVKTDFDLRNTGSIKKSKMAWDSARKMASDEIKNISREGKMLILACLYWGEGNKKELNLINSDPNLIRIFVNCLMDLGVKKDDFFISVRIYEDMNQEKVKDFWAKTIGIKKELFKGSDVLVGKKLGKLEYGMCRIRVRKGGNYFKSIMSMIDLIKSKI